MGPVGIIILPTFEAQSHSCGHYFLVININHFNSQGFTNEIGFILVLRLIEIRITLSTENDRLGPPPRFL